MKLRAPLPGLLWRPGVLWDLGVSVAVAVMLPYTVGLLPFALRGDFEGAKDFEPSALTREFCVAFFIGATLGFVASFAWQDLTHCRFSWLVPGLRRRVRRDLGALALVGAVAAAIVGAVWLPQIGALTAAGLALFGYAWGNHLWDPHSSRALSHLTWSSGLVVVRFSEELAEISSATPVLLVVAPLLCGLSLWQTTSLGATRRRTLVLKSDLGKSFEDYESGVNHAALGRPAGRPHARWRWGSVGQREGWLHALRYEDSGFAGLEWFLRRGGLLAFTQMIIFIGGNVEMALPMSALLIVLFERQDLRRGVAYPMSRPERARLVWSGARQQVSLLLGTSLATYAAFLGGRALLGKGAVDLDAVVHFAAASLLVAGCLPLLQAVRLHLLEFHRGPVTTLRFGTTLLLASTIFCGGSIWLDFQLRELEVGLQFVAAVLVLIASPILFRWHLGRWFRRADLA